MDDIVALVVEAGLGDGYEVLEPREEFRTSGGIDHYAHISILPRSEVEEKLGELKERGIYTPSPGGDGS